MQGARRKRFPEWIKLFIDRICEKEGKSRPELAKDMGVHVHSISVAAYRGDISFDLAETIAKRAKATAEELNDLEDAWLEIRSSRPRDEALRRSLRRQYLLLEWIDDATEHMRLKGTEKDFLRWRAKKAADAAAKKTRV